MVVHVFVLCLKLEIRTIYLDHICQAVFRSLVNSHMANTWPSQGSCFLIFSNSTTNVSLLDSLISPGGVSAS